MLYFTKIFPKRVVNKWKDSLQIELVSLEGVYPGQSGGCLLWWVFTLVIIEVIHVGQSGGYPPLVSSRSTGQPLNCDNVHCNQEHLLSSFATFSRSFSLALVVLVEETGEWRWVQKRVRCERETERGRRDECLVQVSTKHAASNHF